MPVLDFCIKSFGCFAAAAASPDVKAWIPKAQSPKPKARTVITVLTFIAVDATPDNERNSGVEGGGERPHNFLVT